jgi:glycosyltransferase involved in cell wall biosynthesis
MTGDGLRPLVSVVIPCFNQAQFLRDAVSSVAARCARVEVIVVDDGSVDQTASVARGLDGVLLVRQGNRGLAAARNRGLRSASGEFIVFLDADDRLLPGAIDAGLRALRAHPECAMTYGRCVMTGPAGELWPTPEIPAVRSGHHAALLRTNLIWTPAMAMFRRDAVTDAGGFAEGFDGAADYDLYLRVSRDKPIHDHQQPVAAYRRHGGSMSGRAARMLRDTLAVMARNRPDDGHAELRSAWHEGYSRWQDFYGTQLVEEIRAHARLREWAAVRRKATTLASLAPWVFLRELRRAARRRYAGRAIPAAEISAARRRAET